MGFATEVWILLGRPVQGLPKWLSLDGTCNKVQSIVGHVSLYGLSGMLLGTYAAEGGQIAAAHFASVRRGTTFKSDLILGPSYQGPCQTYAVLTNAGEGTCNPSSLRCPHHRTLELVFVLHSILMFTQSLPSLLPIYRTRACLDP